MAALGAELFLEDDLKALNDVGHVWPSQPPSSIGGALLLQFNEDFSDHKAAKHILFDLRRKVAVQLTLDYSGFNGFRLSRYRSLLCARGQERYAFGHFVAVGRLG